VRGRQVVTKANNDDKASEIMGSALSTDLNSLIMNDSTRLSSKE